MNAPSSKSWKWTAAALLRQLDAPRVLTPKSLWDWLASHDIDVSRRSVTNALNDWSDAGMVERVAHGIFLNKQAKPTPRPDEAASYIRQGAVISLSRVLGDSGVLNNPTHWITCVIPQASGIAGGIVDPEGHTFHFTSLNPSFFPSPSDDWYNDAYVNTRLGKTSTPEKALMDWLYLSSLTNGRTRPAPPRHDIDLDLLDLDRCQRLADALELNDVWAAWLNPAAPSLKTNKSRLKF